MFCENCGKPNGDSAKFCAYCGGALQQPVRSNTGAALKNKVITAANKLTKKQKIAVIATIVAIPTIILSAVIASSGTTGVKSKSPEVLVESYINAFNSGKADSIVKCYLNDCRNIYQSEHKDASTEDYLEYYDEFYEDFLGRTIASYEIDEIEYFDAQHEYYENLRECGVNVKGGARAIVYVEFSSGSDAYAFIFMVKTGSGWHIYKVSDWY